MRDAPLKVEIIGDELVISIGVDALAFAVQAGQQWPYDAEMKNLCPITDAGVFAQEVLRELDRELGEDGTTRIHRMFDEAALKALEWGAQGVDYLE